MENSELSSYCEKLIERSNFIYLTTLKENGEPETRAMMNLYNREQFPSLKIFCCFLLMSSISAPIPHPKRSSR